MLLLRSASNGVREEEEAARLPRVGSKNMLDEGLLDVGAADGNKEGEGARKMLTSGRLRCELATESADGLAVIAAESFQLLNRFRFFSGVGMAPLRYLRADVRGVSLRADAKGLAALPAGERLVKTAAARAFDGDMWGKDGTASRCEGDSEEVDFFLGVMWEASGGGGVVVLRDVLASGAGWALPVDTGV